VHCWSDLGYGEFDLWYLRDKEKREVDFLVTDSRKPVVLIECKLTDERPAAALDHFSGLLGRPPCIQLVRTPGVDRTVRGTRVVSAERLLGGLP
jgi:hypothetical protein